MKDINGIELKEGMFLKVIGCKVKNDNSLYIIEVDQNTNENYTTRDCYILHKVNANGTESKAKYNILFIDKWLFEKNPDVEIEVVTDLKQAAKDVKNFLNGITASEKVYSFTDAKGQTLETLTAGQYITFKKRLHLQGRMYAFAGTYKLDHIANHGENIYSLHLVGVKGETVAYNVNNQYQGRPIQLSFKEKLMKEIFNEEYITIQERIETTKGESQKEASKMPTETPIIETVTEVQQEEQKAQEEQTETTQEVTQDQPQQETNNTIERKYFPINEQLAKTSQTLWSFSDYVPNSATNGYKAEVEKAYKIVDIIAIKKPKRTDEALSIAERFSKAYASWINKGYSIESMCPSVMICGAGNFPVRKKEKQNQARDNHYKQLDYINGYLKKLENVLYGNEIIKSGDADAIEKLQEKLDQLEEKQETMKQVNAYYRKNKTLEGCDLLSQKAIDEIKDLMIRISYHTQPFASYSLTNNNAKIKAAKQRIEQLQKAKEEGIKETIKTEVCQVIENSELMRIQLLFDGKPDEQTRSILKSNGFRWAPKNKAWQRQLTDNARYSTKKVIEQLEKLSA